MFGALSHYPDYPATPPFRTRPLRSDQISFSVCFSVVTVVPFLQLLLSVGLLSWLSSGLGFLMVGG